MKEFPVLFGPESRLMGVVTTPDSVPALPVACIMFNMGAYHRIGPRRVNVKLARALAADGVSSIRFDLAGLGDSGAPAGAESFEAQAVLDLKAAMNFMETTHGIRRFLVIGLCSGAASGMAVAEQDPRVVGLLMMDGYAFPSAGTLRARDLHRALAFPTNPAMLGKTLRWLKRKLKTGTGGMRSAPQLFVPDPPELIHARFRRAMTTMAERQVAVLFIYSGTIHVRDKGRDQWGIYAQEPFMQKMEYRFYPQMDHTFITVEGQRLYVAETREWVMHVAKSKAPSSAALAIRAGASDIKPGGASLQQVHIDRSDAVC